MRLVYPREVLELAPPETRNARHPFEWRVKATWEGAEFSISVTPDFVFGFEFLALPAGENIVWFTLEADTGSETVIPETLTKVTKPTLFHKYLGYHTTYRARLHTKRFGAPFHCFRVLTVTAKNGVQVSLHPKTGERIERTRIQSLQEAATLASGGEDPVFFSSPT